MSRILVHEPSPAREGSSALSAAHQCDVHSCDDWQALLERFIERRPDVLISVLDDDVTVDFGVLSLIRRAAPSLPFILLSRPASLQTRRVLQELRPTYYGVLPIDSTELNEAVHDVLESSAERSNI